MKAVLTTLALVLVALPAVAQDKPSVPFYGNEKCPLMGKPVNKRWSIDHEGQRIYLCCRNCWKKAKAEPAKYVEKAYPKDKVKKISPKVCPIMGKPIKGEGKKVTWQGHELTMCCKRCVAAFTKEPNKRLTLILNKDIKDVKNTICPVMPEDKVEPDLFFIYKKKLINICCDSCVTDAQDDPEKYLKKFVNKK